MAGSPPQLPPWADTPQGRLSAALLVIVAALAIGAVLLLVVPLRRGHAL